MTRRELLKFGALPFPAILSLMGALPAESRSEVAERASGKVPQGDAAPFSEADVIAQALALSKAPFSLPEDTVPAEYKALSYNQYRAIRFKKELALWKEDNLPFATEF